MICPKCGVANDIDRQICFNCGTSLDQDSQYFGPDRNLLQDQETQQIQKSVYSQIEYSKSTKELFIIRIISGIFWLLGGVGVLLLGMVSTIDVTSFGPLSQPGIEYSVTIPWVIVGMLSIFVSIMLFSVKRKINIPIVILGLVAMLIAIILFFLIMSYIQSGWIPLIIIHLNFKGLGIVIAYIILFIMLVISYMTRKKSANEYIRKT